METKSRRQFLIGALTGVILTLSIIGGLAALVIQRGVRVDVDIESLAVMVRDEVRSEAQHSLPDMLADLKAGVPDAVATAMATGTPAAPAAITLADFTIQLPEQVTEAVQSQVEAAVAEVVYAIIDQFDTDLTASQLGDEAYGMVKTTLASQVASAAMTYRLFGRLPVPVTLNFR